MLLPGPNSIDDFPPLPDSTKSNLSGDTWQVPNVAAYFSNQMRGFVIPYYYQMYKNLNTLPVPPMRLNYPPEFAFTAIKDQTHSTYLEEFLYPLKGSLFINGYEPFTQDGQPKFRGAARLDYEGKIYGTKTTLKLYPAPFWVKIVIWAGIVLSLYWLWKLGRKVFYESR